MADKFKINPEQPKPALDQMYVSEHAKAWIKKQSALTGASMVSVVDAMVHFCERHEPPRRPNPLRKGNTDG